MKNTNSDVKTEAILPTRKLTAREQKVFDRVLAEFVHLTSADAEMLTQYCEAVARYQAAARETKKNPTIDLPVVNRATGNIVGHKPVRNPAFITLRESQSQANSLARRLMIDSVSTEKRQRLQSKQAKALAAREAKIVAESALKNGITEEQIQGEMERLRSVYIHATEDVIRQQAIWFWTVYKPLEDDPEANDGLYPEGIKTSTRRSSDFSDTIR